MAQASDETALALATERRIYDVVTPLDPNDRIGRAKVLLAQRLSPSGIPESQIDLHPVATVEDWQHYAQERIAVESSFGVDERRARAMVDELLTRAERVGMKMYFAFNGQDVVGATGYFRLAAPDEHCARLQEVDIFPQWRGRGYGTSMLMARLRLVIGAGCSIATIGADEDDWPLDWYRRHEFTDVLRVHSYRD